MLVLSVVVFALFNTGCEKITPEYVTDIDGNIYETVTIGDQVWFAENLRVTKLKDGVYPLTLNGQPKLIFLVMKVRQEVSLKKQGLIIGLLQTQA